MAEQTFMHLQPIILPAYEVQTILPARALSPYSSFFARAPRDVLGSYLERRFIASGEESGGTLVIEVSDIDVRRRDMILQDRPMLWDKAYYEMVLGVSFNIRYTEESGDYRFTSLTAKRDMIWPEDLTISEREGKLQTMLEALIYDADKALQGFLPDVIAGDADY